MRITNILRQIIHKIEDRMAAAYFARYRYQNVKVGECNRKARECWLENTLKKVPAGGRLLDAGAGELGKKKYCPHLNYVSQDFGKYNGSGDAKGLQTHSWDQSQLDIISDITEIPEPDSSFDAIMCIEVFEHLPEPLKALKEFHRLLKKDGLLIITAPFCSITHFSPYHFYSGFNKYFYEHHFDGLGFKVIDIQANGNYFDYLSQEIARIPVAAERYCNCGLLPLESKAKGVLLNALRRLSDKDHDSSSLLCFGYHVFARKKDK